MINSYFKSKRNTYIAVNLAIFLIIDVFVATLLNTLVPALSEIVFASHSYFASYSLSHLFSFVSNLLSALSSIGLVAILNSSSKKAGRPEATISPAYAFVKTALSTTISSLYSITIYTPYLSELANGSYNYQNHAIISLVYSVISLISAFISVIITPIFLFNSENKRLGAIRSKVMNAKFSGAEIKYNSAMFTTNRIIVLVVFLLDVFIYKIADHIAGNLFEGPGQIVIKLLGLIFFVTVAVLTVALTNNGCKKNNKNEDAVSVATLFIPLGINMVSTLLSNLYLFAVNLIEVLKSNDNYFIYFYNYELYNSFISDHLVISNIITIACALLFTAIFTIMAFKHENKKITALFNNGYFEKVEVIIPTVQPMYQQPVQPVYQQPVQPVYQQPVQPVQPVVVPEDKTAVADGNDENK